MTVSSNTPLSTHPIPDSLAGCSVLVWGFGIHGGGLAAGLFAAAEGAKVSVLEHQPVSAFGSDVAIAQAAGWPWHVGNTDHPALQRADLILTSPAISPKVLATLPPDLPVVGVDQLFFARHRGPRIMVTGTKGKSTTAHICGHLLGWPVAGNSFTPLLAALSEHGPESPMVIEQSSFQLWYDRPYHTTHDLAILTCLGQDHLDWHSDLNDYHHSKLTAIANAKQQIIAPSVSHSLSALPSCQFDGDQFYLPDGSSLCPRHHLQLMGEHNAANACLALTAALEYGLDPTMASIRLTQITALPHRLEVLPSNDERLWINDSIATTPEATCAALAALTGPGVLILSGRDKGGDYQLLAEALSERPEVTVIVWNNIPNSCHAALNQSDIAFQAYRTLDELLVAIAGTSGFVALSPAAATLPPHADYAERGAVWRDAVAHYNPSPC